MALSADVQTGILGGLVTDGITKAAVPVKVVVYPDFLRLADLPGGADESGALITGFDPAVPLVTIADSSVAEDTSANLWGYVTDGSGEWKVTVIGDGSLINPSKFTYRLVVTSVDGAITYYEGSTNVPAGSTMWLSALPVKTTASAGSNKTTVNISGGGGGGVSSWTELQDKPAVIAAGADAATARAAIGAGTSDLTTGTTAGTAKPGDWKPDFTNDVTGKPATYPPSAHTTQPSEIVGSTTFGQSLLSLASSGSLRTAVGFSSLGDSLSTAPDAATARSLLEVSPANTANLTVFSTNAADRGDADMTKVCIFRTDTDPTSVMGPNDIWISTAV